MKRAELRKKLEEIAQQKNSAAYKDQENRHQVLLNELFIELLNDYNESTSKSNNYLLALTIVIAILTGIMVIKMFCPGWLQSLKF